MSTTGAELLDSLRERPDDTALREVYADWLEQEGERERAEVVRLHAALLGRALDDPELVERGRALLARGRRLPAAWLAAIAYPALDDSSWLKANVTPGDEPARHHALLRLLPGGLLDHHDPWPPFLVTAGRWQQVGNVVSLEISRYSSHVAVVLGEEMRGAGRNDHGAWPWEAYQVDVS